MRNDGRTTDGRATAFGSGTDAAMLTVTDPEAFYTTQQWVPIGLVVVLVVVLVRRLRARQARQWHPQIVK